jgi:hypothetical protein
MANRTITQLHQLILDALPATGGVELSALQAGLPAEDARTAMGQLQPLKLSGKVKTWRDVNAAGETVTFVGRK